MLIVGTKGRSLGGLQGLMSNRNSFSKWCLQYSPIPVVIVRPTSKRIKKKNKRDADPARQDYIRILRESGIEEHETDTDSQYGNWEISNNPENEAHAVAAALGFSEHDSFPKSSQVDESKATIRARSDNVNLFQEISSQDFELSPKLASVTHNPCIEEHKTESYAKNIDENFCLNHIQLGENIRLEAAKSGINISQTPYQFQMAFETSESSLESQVASVDEQDDNEEETEFEVMPGSFLLNETEIPLSRLEKKLEEIEIDDFLVARETTFLAAQIARNFSMDDCIFNNDSFIIK